MARDTLSKESRTFFYVYPSHDVCVTFLLIDAAYNYRIILVI